MAMLRKTLALYYKNIGITGFFSITLGASDFSAGRGLSHWTNGAFQVALGV